MTTLHTVRQGETIYLLGKRYGVPPDAIWDHPENQELQERNRHQGILYAGEVISVPEREDREEACQTEQRHRFVRRGTRVSLELRFLDLDEPRAGAPYRLVVDHVHTFEGMLDDDGVLTASIPVDAEHGEIWVGDASDEDHFCFAIGHLDPINESSGLRQRLDNLGFSCDGGDETACNAFRSALQAFQQKYDLEPSGELDDATRARLEEIYGS